MWHWIGNAWDSKCYWHFELMYLFLDFNSRPWNSSQLDGNYDYLKLRKSEIVYVFQGTFATNSFTADEDFLLRLINCYMSEKNIPNNAASEIIPIFLGLSETNCWCLFGNKMHILLRYWSSRKLSHMKTEHDWPKLSLFNYNNSPPHFFATVDAKFKALRF